LQCVVEILSANFPGKKINGKENVELKNSVPLGFIEKYRIGNGDDLVFIPLASGFLRLEYLIEDDIPLLNKVAFVATASKHSSIIGRLLELSLGRNSETATYMDEQGLSGIQWTGGSTSWGHVFDGDCYSEREKIELDEWIDRCIEKMINPEKYNLADICKHYDPTMDIPLLKSDDPQARNRFWNKCSPATGKELDQILDLLKNAVKTKDDDILFYCSDPLKRASADIPRLLDTITGLLEGDKITYWYERSVLQEVLEAHALTGNGTIAQRWMMLCKKALTEKGPEAFFAKNEGELFMALTRVPDPGVKVLNFFREAVDKVNAAPPEVRQEIEELFFFNQIKKAVM